MERQEVIQRIGEKFREVNSNLRCCFAMTAVNMTLLVYALWIMEH
jgi:hypothetical protein